MLKTILTEMRANEAFMIATLVATGHLDANATPERLQAVMAEMHQDLDGAGIPAPIAVDVVEPVAVDVVKPADEPKA